MWYGGILFAMLEQAAWEREDTKWDVRLSKEPELCEGCGRLCQTVVDINRERRLLKWLQGRPN